MRYAKQILIGVMDPNDNLLGVIRRSGKVNQLGHFCYVQVSVNGKKRWAGGAEDRIFPFHSVKLDEKEECPKFELRAIGWCKDGNTFAYMNESGRIIDLYGNPVAVEDIKPIRVF